MTDRPYTDDDLRAEATAQHAALLRDPDFMGIGEQMDDETWRDLNEDDFEAAQRAIDNLLTHAADVSEWAINLGADGLEPTGHTFQLGVDPGDGDRPRVRVHFAFAPDMDDDDRDRFVMELSKVIAQNL
ncbi:hypothetical protein ACWC3Y_11120 [Streptomyces sp. NPDC001296]